MDDYRMVEPQMRRKQGGQAMVEYALIAAFVVIAFAVTLAATGPAIGNVFSNVIYGVIGQAPGDPVAMLSTPGGATAFWQTVTWVAANPQRETPYPTPRNLPDRPTATPFVSPTPSLSPTATSSPTATQSRTPTPTATDFVPTVGPSQTPEDKEFLVPFADRADLEMNWRLDRSFVLNVGGWTGTYLNGSDCAGPGPGAPADTTLINYTWAGAPAAGINPDNFIGCWTNTFTLAADTPLRFVASALVGGSLTVKLDGSTILSTSTQGNAANQTISAGTHTLEAEYAHGSGAAQVYLLIERPSQNPDDTTTAPQGCPFASVNDPSAGSPFTGSPSNVFEDNPPLGPSAWAAGQTCYLELRGWVNSAAAPNPKLSFWDVWDFISASGVSVDLQIANYDETSPGSRTQDRTATWGDAVTIPLGRTGGSANYNWTRTQINLSDYTTIGDRWTFRFRLSSSGGGTLSWYIDDVQVLNDSTPTRTFTVQDIWNLNARSQMADFIFNADANFTREQTVGSPPSSEWRWNILSDRARSGTAWVLKDYAPSAATSNLGAQTDRVYYLELRYPIDVSASRSPAPPSQDYEGDTGVPLLSFWQAYIGTATRVVEYALLSDPNTWIEAPYIEPLTPPPVTTMQRNSVLLPTTGPFRLRFKLTINQGLVPSVGDGWFIDDIQIERDLGSPYAAYPFNDSAESTSFTAQHWTTANNWAATTLVGGVQSSGYSYADSPGSNVNYTIGTPTRFEMRRKIDLLDDSPDNTLTTVAAAAEPMLTFWMRRDLQGSFRVELWTAQSNTWTTAWTMDFPGTRSRNAAWERIEINVAEAISVNTGRNWSTVGATDGNTADDDIKLRFVLSGAGTTAYDGVYVDGISIQDKAEVEHQLGDSGDGIYTDSIDATQLADRWYLGGSWNWTNETGHVFETFTALADSPLQPYQANAISIAEIKRVFDLSGVTAGQIPSLDFYTRFDIAAGDRFQVEIAERLTGGTQQYIDIDGRSANYGWSAWTPVTLYPLNNTVLDNWRIETMHRWRVRLDSYVGKDIRIRFVLRTDSAGAAGEGITIDAVSLTYGVNAVTSLPASAAMDPAIWILEGSGATRWGTTTQFVTGGTSGADSGLGTDQWYGLYFDCETLMDPDTSCSEGNYASTYNSLLNTNTNDPFDTVSALPAGITRPVTNPAPDLNFWTTPALQGDNAPFADTFAARWTRNVVLTGGATYRFYVISDEAVRITINDKNGISPVLPTVGSKHYLIDAWFPHDNQLDVRTITIAPGPNLNRVLTVEFFDTTDDSVLSLTNVAQRFSFSDSPNLENGTGYTTVLSTRYGNSSLTYRNFIDTTGGGKTLSYSLLWNFRPNTTLYVETSNDGGFTWTVADTIPSGGLPTSNLPPNQDWVTRSVPLAAGQPNVTFRFRLATFSEGNNITGDGAWISNISVQ